MIDRSGSLTGAFSDLSKVEKYEISEESYEKRTGNTCLRSALRNDQDHKTVWSCFMLLSNI